MPELQARPRVEPLTPISDQRFRRRHRQNQSCVGSALAHTARLATGIADGAAFAERETASWEHDPRHLLGVSEWFESFGFAAISEDRSFWLGAYPADEQDVAQLRALGIEQVFSLCEDKEYLPGQRQAIERAFAAAGISEQRLPSPDFSVIAPELLEQGIDQVCAALERGRRVYLHCRAGWQRSATLAAGVLARREGLDAREALAELTRRKPTARPLPEQADALIRLLEPRR